MPQDLSAAVMSTPLPGRYLNLGTAAACASPSFLTSLFCDLSDDTSSPSPLILSSPFCAPAGTAANSKAVSIKPNAPNPQNPFFIVPSFFIFLLVPSYIRCYKFCSERACTY